MTPEEELRYLQKQHESLVYKLDAARAATWAEAPGWNYAGTEVRQVSAEEMSRASEAATSRVAPPPESVALIERKIAQCNGLIDEASYRLALERGGEPSEEKEAVERANDVAVLLGEHKDDMEAVQQQLNVPVSDFSGKPIGREQVVFAGTGTAFIPPGFEKGAEHPDPTVSAAIALYAVGRAAYSAYTKNKDGVDEKVGGDVAALSPQKADAITEKAQEHAKEQEDQERNMAEARAAYEESHRADPPEKRDADKQALDQAESEARQALFERQAADFQREVEQLTVEQPPPPPPPPEL